MSLKEMRSLEDLANTLGITKSTLTYYAYRANRDSLHKDFRIPKKSGGERQIFAPGPKLLEIQRNLLPLLCELRNFKACVSAFVKGKGIKTNAAMHVGRGVVINFDLNNFFPNISGGRIYGMLTSAPYQLDAKVAHCITRLCTHHDFLPQGSATSPVLSNLICGKLDAELFEFAKEIRAYYSRYADDITFSFSQSNYKNRLNLLVSGDGSTNGWSVSDKISNLISDNGFLINPKKTRVSFRTSRQTVTGLVVNEKVNVDRRFVRKIRSMLFDWRVNGWAEAGKNHSKSISATKPFQSVVRGHIAHVKDVKGLDDPVFNRLAQSFNSLPDHGADIKVQLSAREQIEASTWILEASPKTGDDPDDLCQGTVFKLGNEIWITCGHCVQNGNGQRNLEVHHPNSSEVYEAEIIKVLENIDIALIKVPKLSEDVEPLKLLEDGFKQNSTLTVSGYPNYSDGSTISQSDCQLISVSKAGAYATLVNGIIRDGISGAPITNQAGQVVGVVLKVSGENNNAISSKCLNNYLSAEDSNDDA